MYGCNQEESRAIKSTGKVLFNFSLPPEDGH